MHKRRASNYERELQKKLWEMGFVVFRIAGSGSSPLPAADLIAVRNGKPIVIEVKTTRNGKIYLDKGQLEELKIIQESGIPVYVAVKFIGTKTGWFLFKLDDVLENNKITLERAKKEGYKLETFLKLFSITLAK